MAESGFSAQPLEALDYRLQINLALLVAGIAAITVLAWPSVAGMVDTWTKNSAYNHGFFILPIAAYMAWERRHRMGGIAIRPYWPGLIILTGFAFAWTIAYGAAIREGEQIAYVGMLQGLILTLLGRKLFRAQLLPIMYLWLMVPTGAFLLPALQTIATWLAGHLLQFTGIPFYAEGFYFQLPVGLFYVAPGCAGLNFLLAALALSIVYADLIYTGWQRKLICIITWMVAAILANGVRIFLILWLAEISNKQLAIVDDHILYGWGFFLLILMGLMWGGRRFSNISPPHADDPSPAWLPRVTAPVGASVFAVVASMVIVSATLGYGLMAFTKGTAAAGYSLEAPAKAGAWELHRDPDAEVRNGFGNADARRVWRIENGALKATLLAAYYNGQWEGHEAASAADSIFTSRDVVTIARAMPALQLQDARYTVQERMIQGRRENLQVWRWYCTDGRFVETPMKVRLGAFLTRLGLRPTETVVFTLIASDSETAREDMTAFLEALSRSEQGLMVANSQSSVTHPASCW